MQKQQHQANLENGRNNVPPNAPEDTPPTNEQATVPPATNEPVTPQPQTNDNQTTEPVQPAPPPASTAKRTVYLTFDDGPQVFSKDIIALLELYHFKATFFMIDGNIRRFPDAVKLMVQVGEGVGLHSVTHDKNLFYASVDSVLGELNQNRATLKDVAGVDSFLMRTPYGSFPYMTEEYKKAVSDQGYLMWDWNIDSKDWYYKDERYITNVIEQMNVREKHNGPIVILLHEKKETLAHLPKLLDYLSKQNIECKAIDSKITPIHF
jgi:peptidoglycan/xylan/chitin deacetylase (PgdA/CDA1 family)